jgi:DNA topoisomerase-1
MFMDIYKKNKKFFINDKEIKDKETLTRLGKLVVPPAWTDVRYSSDKNSHIQVYGYDKIGKKQYILSDKWILKARSKKYNRLRSFISDLPAFRKKIALSKDSFTKERLIHLLFNLLLDTHIRVGNEIYAQTNKTYGLTTLRQKHVIINGNTMVFSFVGKSKIQHIIEIPHQYNWYIKKLIVPGNRNKPLFVYNNSVMTSEDLNEYLKEHMGNYTCKDFRTYSANIVFIKTLLSKIKSEKIVKKTILECIDESAKSLGNSRSICKNSYISNNLIDYINTSKPRLEYQHLITKI